ncbi:MAG: hypothetical protein U5O15_05985 [Candidatus Krumholzibacteriota bacterium]|nr:hypothetical protein [Candidatus Krumholzibacteriota bacterium]
MGGMTLFIRACIFINISLILTNVNLSAEIYDDSAAGSIEGFSEEEYRVIKFLQDNPVDLYKASVGDLMEIPGFTIPLARRVIKAVNQSEDDSDWMLLLSPRDRKEIVKYKRFIIIPSVKGYNFELRYTSRHLLDSDGYTDDGYIHLENEWADFSGRIRRRGGAPEMTAYVLFDLIERHLSFYVGDFLPDFAMGLVAEGQTFYYPFSYSYPLNNYRFISKGTYFYGKVIRGMATCYKRGLFRIFIFNGLMRKYKDGKFIFSDNLYRGGRLETKIGESKVGASIIRDGTSSGNYAGIDARIKRGSLDLGLELALSAEGGKALSCAGSIKKRKTKAGILLYNVNRYFGNSLGRIPADGRKLNGMQRGISVVVEREFLKDLSLRCSIERWMNRRSYLLENKLSLRFQLIRKMSNKKIRLAWKHSEKEKKGAMLREIEPFSASNTLKLLFNCKAGEHVKIRNSMKIPWEEDSYGYLIAPSVEFTFMDGLIKGNYSFAAYRALEGNPSYYYYQPSVRGSFAWKHLSGSGFRNVIGFELYYRKTLIHLLFSVDSSGKTDMTVQAVMGL